MSVGDKNENEIGSSYTLEIPESSPTFPSSRSGENRTQIASDINGKPDGNIEGRASTCSPLIQTSNTECEIVKVISITEFFYDDQNAPYTPLPGSAVIIIQTQIEKKGKKEKVTTSMS